jgi:hypothetical protein
MNVLTYLCVGWRRNCCTLDMFAHLAQHPVDKQVAGRKNQVRSWTGSRVESEIGNAMDWGA